MPSNILFSRKIAESASIFLTITRTAYRFSLSFHYGIKNTRPEGTFLLVGNSEEVLNSVAVVAERC
jgi:hypothetical protein